MWLSALEDETGVIECNPCAYLRPQVVTVMSNDCEPGVTA